jgi:DNA invertase Pin-like site-specific DNA recombinase
MSPKPSRMDGYIRVSRVGGRAGDSFISPAVQREQIAGWAKLRGVAIDAWHEDLDQSGGKINRPGLTAMLDRLEAGDTEGVVVAKLDRLSRLGAADALMLVKRITDAGGSIAAIDLGLDPTTPTGEMMLTMMLGMAHMERRRLSESWDEAKTRAMERGAKIGPTPYGYQRDEGALVLHPTEAPILAEAFRLAAADGIEAARAHMLRAAPQRASSNYTTRRLLASRAYIGESIYGGRVVRDAHPPLVDRATWEAAQHEPTMRQRPDAKFPLSGIAVCGTCGSRMIGHRSPDRKRPSGVRAYRCSARAGCVGPASTRAAKLEDMVREAIREAWGRPGWSHGGTDVDTSAAEAALQSAEHELEQFAADLTARELLGQARYHDALQARVSAVDAAQATYRREASKQAHGSRVLPVELLDTEDPAELRELFAAGLSAVVVERGRGPIVDRVQVITQGDDRVSWVPAAQDAPRRSVQTV